MPTYTVHAPPPHHGETTSAPERFVFVRDGFHFWAFLLTPLWLLLHGLWLALVIYVVGYGVVGGALTILHASAKAQFLAGLLIALLIGFEAPSIWRWTLTRRGWTTLGFVVGEDAEIAEQRFFFRVDQAGRDFTAAANFNRARVGTGAAWASVTIRRQSACFPSRELER
jgi:Protein of unknown function (DUF2628).